MQNYRLSNQMSPVIKNVIIAFLIGAKSLVSYNHLLETLEMVPS